MQKIGLWIAILIGLFLVVAYYRGSSSVLAVFGQYLQQTIFSLQGRDSKGAITNYPQDSNVGYYG